MSKPLIPPDYGRCQAEKPASHSFMTLGGVVGAMERCKNTPSVIVAETKPGKDGQCGSMSMCADCFEVFKKQVGVDGYDIRPAIRPLTTAELSGELRAISSAFPDDSGVVLEQAANRLEAYEKARTALKEAIFKPHSLVSLEQVVCAFLNATETPT